MPKLRQDQIEGIEFIEINFKKQKGVLLADRMGVGKTAQAIEILKRKINKNPCLIICPAYLIYNWLDELKFWRIKNDICIIDSGKQLIKNTDIYIVSYNMITNKNIFKQLFKINYSLIVCDEGHYLKEWNSLRSRRILGTHQNRRTNLLNKTDNILLLTGTPVLNRVEELYNLIIRIAPKALQYMAKEKFIITFAEKYWHTQWGLKHSGVKNEKLLSSKLKNVMLIRNEIKGLPSRINKTISISLKNQALKNYIEEENKFLKENKIYKNDIVDIQKLKKSDMTKLIKLRQKAAMYKIPILINLINDIFIKTDNMLIYTYHKNIQSILYTLLKNKFKEKKIELINGQVSMSDRYDILNKFKIKKCDIILTTIGALKEGVNIVSTNVIIFLEYDWTPANMEQAIARLHRHGQKKTVFVYFLSFLGGVDAYMANILKEKTGMIKKVMK